MTACVCGFHYKAPEGWRSPKRFACAVAYRNFAPASWSAAALRRFSTEERLIRDNS